MLRNYTKNLFIICSTLSLVLLSSCSYENTTINLGSGFNSTWDFSKSSSYEFDDNLVELVNGKAQLKVLNLNHFEEDFTNGSSEGVGLNEGALTPMTKVDVLSTHVNSILPNRTSELIGYWRFDGNYQDSSLLENHAQAVNGAELSEETFLGAGTGSFESNSGYIEINHNAIYNTSSISMSVWVYPTHLSGNTGIVCKGEGNGGEVFCIDTITTGKVRGFFWVGGSSYIVEDSADLKLNTWSHILFVYDSVADLKLYVNGKEVASTTPGVGSLNSNMQSITVGARQSTNGPYDLTFTGRIDEFAVWSEALTSSEAFKLYSEQNKNYTELSKEWTPKWNHLVGYWKMDGNWKDSTGNGNDGYPVGSPTFSDTPRIGRHALSFHQNAINERVEVPDASSLDIADHLTVSGWMYYGTTALPNHNLISKASNIGDAQFVSYFYGATNSFLFYANRGGSWSPISSTAHPEQNKWFFFTLTYNSVEGGQLYIDGVAQGSRVGAGLLATNNSPLIFGEGFNFIDANTSIDDVAIWNIELNKYEVLEIYNRQKQKYVGHFDSQVIDLGNTTATWPDLSWSVNLPYGKELVGDFNNDGTADSESPLSYSGLSGDLADNLEAYYKLDGDASESSGNNHVAIVNSVPSTEQPAYITPVALRFDGVDDSISLPSTILGSQSTTGVTFSAWVKVNELGRELGIVGFSSGGGWSHYGGGGIWIAASGLFTMTGWDGSSYVHATSSSPSIIGVWQHIVGIFEPSTGDYIIYVNGQEEGRLNVGTIQNHNTWNFIGRNSKNDAGEVNKFWFNGAIDEVAVWSRPLNSIEVQQLYRRGANRVKLQVKSCIDSACECKSYGAGGTETDCDGDTIINALDSDDSHKAVFIGPGGDNSTYYSELYNRASTDVIFNCALNTSDSNSGICVEDEVTLSGLQKPTSPEFLNIDYTQFLNPGANRYAQYRVYMEADENTACNGEPCLPELSSVSLNPSGAIKYSNTYVEIRPKAAIVFSEIISVKIVADACASFRLIRNSNSYYYNGTSWDLVSADVHRNSASDIQNHILQFVTQFGPGPLQVFGYLQSDLGQNSQCSIDEIDIKYK